MQTTAGWHGMWRMTFGVALGLAFLAAPQAPARDYFTELFSAGDNDLDYRMLTFVPDGSSNYYAAFCSTIAALPTDPAGGTALALDDDDFAEVTLGGGATVNLYGTAHGSLFIGSNGYITFGEGDDEYWESLDDHFRLPRVSGFFVDLDPTEGGTISWKQTADRVAVTFDNILDLDTDGRNSFQMELFFNGMIRFAYLTLSNKWGLAGLSEGAGTPSDFKESDLTAYEPPDDLHVVPGAGFDAVGYEGGPFSPTGRVYVLTNLGASAVAWAAGATSAWLGVAPAGGTLAVGGSTQVWAALQTSADSLVPGVYADTVVFSNTASGVARTRPATLTVKAIPGEIVIRDTIAPYDDTNMPFGRIVVGKSRLEQCTISNSDAVYPLVVSGIALGSAAAATSARAGIVAPARTPGKIVALGRAPAAASGAAPAAAPLAAPSAVPCYGVELVGSRTVSFSSATPGDLTDIGTAGSGWYAVDFLNGDFSTLYVLDDGVQRLQTVNTATAAQTVIGACTPVSGHTWTGLAGDPTDGTLYGASSDGSSSVLYRIAPGTGAATLIGTISNAPVIIAIAINAAGAMYGVEIGSDVLVAIDKTTGAGTVIGSLGVSANYAQGLDFDEQNDILYWAAFTTAAELRTIDVASGASTLVGTFPANTELEMAVANGGLPSFTLTNGPALPVSIPPGGAVTIDVNYAPPRAGSNAMALVISSNDKDDPRVAVPLSGRGVPDELVIDPESVFASSGHPGGPFSPSQAVYQVDNLWTASIPWTAVSEAAWCEIAPAGGTLDAGASIAVTARLTAAAAALGQGVYTGAVVFSNQVSGIAQARTAVLEVFTTPRITVTPASFRVTNVLGGAQTRNLAVGNASAADAALTFSVTTRELGQGVLDQPGQAPAGVPAGRSADRSASPAAAADATPARDFTRIAPGVAYRPDRVLVRLEDGIKTAAQRDGMLAAAIPGAVAERAFKLVPGLARVALPPGITVADALKRLNGRPGVRYAEPDYRVRAIRTPNDPRFGDLWGMHNTGQTGGTPDADIDAPEAWDLATGRTNIIVGVVDTGVDYNHEDLAAAMWRNPREIPANGLDDDANGYVDDVHGINAINGSGNPLDDNDHGTHCAGTIGGVGDNGIGVAGVCWRVRIMALKFLDAGGSGDTSDAITCVDYAARQGARVLNNSWGGGGYSQALKDAIDAAGASGLVFCAAAGNSGIDTDASPHYPSAYESPAILAVMATDQFDARVNISGWWASNYGRNTVDLAAPGHDILSCKRGGGYVSFDGTSMATPHVSGACALLLARNPLLTAAQVKQALMSAVDVPAVPLVCVSSGRLNLARALVSVQPSWLTATPRGGTNLAPGTAANIALRFDAGNLAAGAYTGDVVLASNDRHTPVTNVPAVLVILPDALRVSPAAGLSATGALGGPFSPASRVYTLSNSGPTALSWQASRTQAWVTLAPGSGMLAAGAARSVTVSVNNAAAALPVGDYADTVTFSNGASGAIQRRTVTLGITPILPQVFRSFLLDTDPGWTREGQWAFGKPQGLGGDPAVGHTGTNVFGYNLAGPYSNSMPVRCLTTSPLNCRGFRQVQVRIWRWLGVESARYDRALFQASSNGSDWVSIWTNGATFTDTSWTQVSYDLSALADDCPALYLRWAMGPTDSSVTYCGWNIDDLELQGVPMKTPAQVMLQNLNQTYNGQPRRVTAVTTPAGLPVAIAYDGTTNVPVNAGSYTVVGTVVHAAYAGGATGRLAVAKASQTVAFPPVPDQVVTNRLRLLAAAGSGLPVAFRVVSGPAALSGGTLLSFTAAGRVSLAASQAGNANWNPAAAVTRAFTVLSARSPAVRNADFDGDGKADPAVYNEATGTWTVLLSSAGYARFVFAALLGGPGWQAAAADYDGDRMADPTVLQEAAGTWKSMESGAGYALRQRTAFLGAPGRTAVSADYDGDRRADYAVYQESSGAWSLKLSSAGYAPLDLAAFLGGFGQTAASADYDGDGLADPTVYRWADGTWSLRLSSAGYAPLTLPRFLGGPGWEAAPGDYDGDGKADPAVRRGDGQLWRILLSGAGYAGIDVPLGL